MLWRKFTKTGGQMVIGPTTIIDTPALPMYHYATSSRGTMRVRDILGTILVHKGHFRDNCTKF
jgi:hypothetical protein